MPLLEMSDKNISGPSCLAKYMHVCMYVSKACGQL
jgi:hypothetical protein